MWMVPTLPSLKGASLQKVQLSTTSGLPDIQLPGMLFFATSQLLVVMASKVRTLAAAPGPASESQPMPLQWQYRSWSWGIGSSGWCQITLWSQVSGTADIRHWFQVAGPANIHQWFTFGSSANSSFRSYIGSSADICQWFSFSVLADIRQWLPGLKLSLTPNPCFSSGLVLFLVIVSWPQSSWK